MTLTLALLQPVDSVLMEYHLQAGNLYQCNMHSVCTPWYLIKGVIVILLNFTFVKKGSFFGNRKRGYFFIIKS